MDVPIQEGDIINDAYKVERVIGSGGMAVVVAALDLHIPRRVAIKVLFKRAAGSPEVLKRFEREQQVVLKLHGEHIARLLDSGIYKNAPYMVMEYLQGSNLAEALRVQGPLPIDQAVEFMLQTCEAVAEAHARDVVHRDLKPGNLFLTRRADGSPCIKVLDFGIAKVLAHDRSAEESTLTKTTTVMGSPFYMSPEQIISPKSVDRPSDIWSMGVILYELIAGKIPFAAKSPERVCARVLNDPPDSLRSHRPDCPEALEAAIVRCLQRQPKNRPADVADFARTIAPFAPKPARSAVSRIERILRQPDIAEAYRASSHDLVAARDAGDPPEAPTVYIPAARKGVSSKALLMALFGVVMLGVGFAGGLLLRNGPSAPPSAPPLPPPSESTTAVVFTPPPVADAQEPAPQEAPDPSAALADIPIEMDLDDEAARLAAQRRAELRRKREREAAAAAAADAQSPDEPVAASDAAAPEPVTTTTALPTPPRTAAPPASTRTPAAATGATSSPRPTAPAPLPLSPDEGTLHTPSPAGS